MSDLTVKRRRSGAISGAERITGVKNAQADMLLSRKKQHYDVLFKRKEQVCLTHVHAMLFMIYTKEQLYRMFMLFCFNEVN